MISDRLECSPLYPWGEILTRYYPLGPIFDVQADWSAAITLEGAGDSLPLMWRL